MPHQVQLSDSTFARLQKLAIPLIDDIDTIVTQLLDAYDKFSIQSQGLSELRDEESPIRVFSEANAPDLTHTKVLTARISGKN